MNLNREAFSGLLALGVAWGAFSIEIPREFFDKLRKKPLEGLTVCRCQFLKPENNVAMEIEPNGFGFGIRPMMAQGQPLNLEIAGKDGGVHVGTIAGRAVAEQAPEP